MIPKTLADPSCAGASTHEIAAKGGGRFAGMMIRYTCRETARRGPGRTPLGPPGSADLPQLPAPR